MSAPAPAAADPDGELYESYLDGALAGAAEEPAAFFARHRGASPEVRARIETLHRISRDGAAAPKPRGPARVAEPGLPRERFGEFRLLRRIGEGGMGVVYEAEQESLGRLAAVKVLRADLLVSPEARERFRREAQAVARLRHPNVVSVLSTGEEEGYLWIALDLVAGRGLDRILREEGGGGIAPARAVRFAARIARALEYAHGRGVVHRDVKPANILVGPGDEPFLLDFGVARDAEAGTTIAGPFVGSVPWAAPEQLAGRAVDGRADVYALGATLFHALTGHVPFEEPGADRAIHRILHEEPVAPGRRRAGIPRDLDAVVLRALEKEPAHRYAGAGEFAEDLEAVLEFRPVRARPPGPLRRARAWARLHPGWAAGAATAALGAAVLVGTLLSREAAAREKVRLEALDELAGARAQLESFRRQRDEAAALEKEVGDMQDLVQSRWLPPETDAAREAKEVLLRRLRQEREQEFHGVLDHLRRAERLAPESPEIERVRAALYLEKWKDAEAARDRDAAEVFRGLVSKSDPDGALSRSAFGTGKVRFEWPVPGGEVHLFRSREETEVRRDGERRLVHVPRGASPIPPGSVALRVIGGAGDLHEGDLVLDLDGRPVVGGAWLLGPPGRRILAVDGNPVADVGEFEQAVAGEGTHLLALEGGADAVPWDRADPVGDPRQLAERGGLPARVLVDGEIRRIALPPGLILRTTAAPVPFGPWSRLPGPFPAEVALEPGSWLGVFRAPGQREQRRLFHVAAGGGDILSLRPAPESDGIPAEFRRVPLPENAGAVDLLDREITSAEYLEFLNDPATLASLEPGRIQPRNARDPKGGHWKRGEDGRFSLTPGWLPGWPVIGVSFEDAQAYAAWRTARDRPLGGRGAYSLPTLAAWLEASGRDTRRFVCGNRMLPKWTKSCFARRTAHPEPGLRFPRDESALGIFDMAGSVAEWLDDVYDAERGTRRVAGGCWAWGKLELFEIWGGQGWNPKTAGDETGFRLMLREAPR